MTRLALLSPFVCDRCGVATCAGDCYRRVSRTNEVWRKDAVAWRRFNLGRYPRRKRLP